MNIVDQWPTGCVQVKCHYPVGDLYITAGEQGLVAIAFKKLPYPMMTSSNQVLASARIIKKTRAQLNEYFQGQRQMFDLPLMLKGTDFQCKVWRALLTVAYGKTVSYAEIARQIQCPKAYRAVGMANRDNPIVIVIPCHRVIASNGHLGGYVAGDECKRMLLRIEQQNDSLDFNSKERHLKDND